MSNRKGIILAINFEDFIIFPLILVLSVLSLRICYRKIKRVYYTAYQCPNKDCIHCRRNLITKQKLLTRLKNYKLNKQLGNHELLRLENSIVKSDNLKNVNSKLCNEQSPTVLLLDGLRPAKPFHFERTLENLKVLSESKSKVIFEEELKDALEKDFLWSKNDVQTGSWKLFYFFNQGKMQLENCGVCPKTAEIILKIPELINNCCFGNAGFSALTPGSKIPIHTGSTNARLRCHVTILPGSQCRITVGKEQQVYEDKQIILFDDSFPHFVENKGDKEVRVVLMIDIWHPEVTQIERDAIKELYSI